MKKHACQSIGTLLLIAIAGCGTPPPPAPTVALAEAARPGVKLHRGGETIALSGARRVEDGAEIETPAGSRATLRLDGGSWALLDEKTRVRAGASTLTIVAGRVWIDARDVDATTVTVGASTLTATQAGFSVEVDEKGAAHAYCVAGQLTYAAKIGNRLESGMAVRLSPAGEAKEEPEAPWDDWTGGLAEPGPPRAPEPAGIGQLAARSASETGAARNPLLVRRHDVRTTITRDLAVTDVEQVFFNPRSEELDGIYTLRLPAGAIVANFEVRTESESASSWSSSRIGRYVQRVVPPVRPGEPVAGIALQYAGPDRYRAAISGLLPGKTRIVHVRYVEWLSRRAGRRTWVYPMGGLLPPLLGEFSLEVDTQSAGASALEAGMGAQVEHGKVVLRRSDFRPHADFALDLLDGKDAASHATPAYQVAAEDGIGSGYLLVPLDLPMPAPPASLDLVLVADVSAATDPTRLDLEKAVVDAILRQLGPGDRVAVLAVSTGTVALGAGDALQAVSPKRSEELLDALARQAPAGATDLGKALEQATALLPDGKGAVVYVGDGQPTVGALLAAPLRDRLLRLGHPPRLFAVGVGGGARMDLLSALALGGGLSLHVEDRPEAAHAAYRVLAAAQLPTLREVRFDLGPTVDVSYPTAPEHVTAGAPVLVLGRLRGAAPNKIKVTGLRDGEPFALEVPLATAQADDAGDIRRRWAAGRLDDLLARGAGREAVTEVGTRFTLITPWSALVTDGGRGYTPLDPFELPDLFGQRAAIAGSGEPPDDAPIALEAGTTSTARPRGSLDPLYIHALGERDEGLRACYDRKAAGHPELSGRVTFSVKVGLGGEVAGVRSLGSSLRDAQVEACMTRAIAAMRLPPPPDGKIHEVVRAWQFEAEDGRLGAPSRCSTASRQYLATRRSLWRERLSQNPGVEGAMAAWRRATASCELRTWLDRQALLDLLRAHVGPTVNQVDLYHRFEGQEDAQAHLRREILRAVRTSDDVRAVRGGLALDGGISAELIDAQLAKAQTGAARARILRQFLALAPDGIALRVRLLSALEQAAAEAPNDRDRAAILDDARRVAAALRGDPAADLAARQAVGEFFLRRKDPAEAERAFSEIVEFAPFDPWARRRLGDLFLASGWFEDAYREYATLAWLTPTDGSVLLSLARAAAGAGRTDEALRLEERLAEAVESRGGGGADGVPGWARAFISLQLAGLRDGARNDPALLSRLAARGRADGVLGGARGTLVAITWPHPDARLELSITPPDDKVGRRAETKGGLAGVEALRLARQLPGVYTLTVRRAASPASSRTATPAATAAASAAASDRVRAFDAELWVLFDEAQPNEKLLRLPIHLLAGASEAAFTLQGRAVTPRLPAVAAAP